jgi:hypothetical protein
MFTASEEISTLDVLFPVVLPIVIDEPKKERVTPP